MDVEFKDSVTNAGKPCVIIDGFIYRKDYEYKVGEISWRCSLIRKKCSTKVRTNTTLNRVISGTNEFVIQFNCFYGNVIFCTLAYRPRSVFCRHKIKFYIRTYR